MESKLLKQFDAHDEKIAKHRKRCESYVQVLREKGHLERVEELCPQPRLKDRHGRTLVILTIRTDDLEEMREIFTQCFGPGDGGLYDSTDNRYRLTAWDRPDDLTIYLRYLPG